MRVLLDESVPRRLAGLLPQHEIQTVADMGWAGTQNGELLRLAAGRFDVVLTADQNIEHHQNLATLPVSVVVLVATTNRIESLRPLIPALLQTLERLAPRQFVRVE